MALLVRRAPLWPDFRMKQKRSFEPHLVLTPVTLPARGEWTAPIPGWSFLSVTSGVAYWLHPRANHELVPGSAVLISDRAPGVIRASELSEVRLRFFRLHPNRLTGVLSWGEQQRLDHAAARDQAAFRVFVPTLLIAQQFREICAQTNGNALPLRLKLLDLFIQAFADERWEELTSPDQAEDAKARLSRLLAERPASDLLELSFGELVRQVRCTPRHLSRIFSEIVGMSFREKQSQLRLIRAQELLATTQSKVVEVALESGYQSLSLFNLMFKRQFGLSPAKWRDQRRGSKSLLSQQRMRA